MPFYCLLNKLSTQYATVYDI